MAVERGPILVWGAGAIGGTIGAHLVRAGQDVTFVDRDRDHVAAMQRKGLSITGPMVRIHRPGEGGHGGSAPGPFARVFLCVKAQDTADASRALLPHVTEDGYVVSAQNGLNELTIAKILGEATTMGCFVNFGADYMEPGVIHYAGRGSVVIGEIDGKETARLQELHRLLRNVRGARVLTQNIWGYLWGKLAYGAMLFATALTNASIADCLASERHRRLFIALAREALARGGRAQGGQARGLRWLRSTAFRPGMSEAAAPSSLDHWWPTIASAKTHCGIWRDLAVRKRKTEVEAQLGPVVEHRPRSTACRRR